MEAKKFTITGGDFFGKNSGSLTGSKNIASHHDAENDKLRKELAHSRKEIIELSKRVKDLEENRMTVDNL